MSRSIVPMVRREGSFGVEVVPSEIGMARENAEHPEAQTIEVPMQIPTPNHAGARFKLGATRKKQRDVITLALRTMCTRPPLPVRVTLTRVAWKELDDDNLAYAFKAIRDAIAEWLGVKDGPRDPVTWRYAQTPAAKGYQAARVRIERLYEVQPESIG